MNNNRKTILITGAAGFLGSYLASECREAGYDLVGVDIVMPHDSSLWKDFFQQACGEVDFESIFNQYSPCIAFHLAGGASVAGSIVKPYDDFQSLLPGTLNLIESAGRASTRPVLVLFSSAAVYGNPESLPIAETASIKPLSPYGIHKALAESVFEHYGRLHGIQTKILRIFSAYGPGLRRQLMWDVCAKLCGGGFLDAGRETVEFYGTGEETRDFIFVEDIAKAALHIANTGADLHEVYNVASGIETTVKQIVGDLAHALESDREYKFSQMQRPGDPLHWRADVTKLKATGFEPAITISNGIARVAKWFRHLHS